MRQHCHNFYLWEVKELVHRDLAGYQLGVGIAERALYIQYKIRRNMGKRSDMWDIPREKLLNAVSTSHSFAMILEKLGYNKRSSNKLQVLKKRLVEEGVVLESIMTRTKNTILDSEDNVAFKICSVCGETRPISEFPKKEKTRGCYCVKCKKQYQRKYYQKNKKDYINRAKKAQTRLRKWFAEYKAKLVCEFCGESHVACLDFHHINSKEKLYPISILVARGYNKEKILVEIEKCKVLCANCHRKLHYIKYDFS